MGKRLLSECEAIIQYCHLLDEHKTNNTILDKGASLRARFDVILRMGITALRNGNPQKEDLSGFQVMIDLLVSSKSEQETNLNHRLHQTRLKFNKSIAHIFEHEQSLRNGYRIRAFEHKDYEFCLTAITDLIAYLSGVPIPPQLLSARQTLCAKPILGTKHLDITILVELYDNLENVHEGALFAQKFFEMLAEKERLKIETVNLNLVTYCPSLAIANPLSLKKEETTNTIYSSSPIDDALKAALLLSNHSDEKYQNNYEKPWLMWICRSVGNRISQESQIQLQKLMDEKKIGFYPMCLKQKAKQDFLFLWPSCGPKDLNPQLIDNFCKSILETVQKKLSK